MEDSPEWWNAIGGIILQKRLINLSFLSNYGDG